MKRILLTLAVTLVAAAALSAAPLCTSLTLPIDVNAISDSPGCDVGTLTFTNWSAVPMTTPGTTVYLTPGTGVIGDTSYLWLNPSLTANQDIAFYVTITGGVSGVDMSVSGFGASVLEVVCSAPLVNNICPAGTELARYTVTSGNSASVMFGQTYGTVYVYKNILTSGTGSELSSVVQSFHTAVPEPMTFGLIGAGLFGLGLLRRKIRS